VAVGPGGLALAALAGTWLGHFVEYARVWHRPAGFGAVHVYMGPLGAVLLGCAVAGMHATARLARALRCRLDSRPADTRPLPWSLGLPAVVALLWAWQCGLYVLQENLEQALLHRTPAGLGVITGLHAWAPAVHLVAAALIASVLWLVRRRVTELVEEVRAAEGRAPRRRVQPVPTTTPVRAWTPAERWGRQLWSRPPPAHA
jgi:hypothetical protein